MSKLIGNLLCLYSLIFLVAVGFVLLVSAVVRKRKKNFKFRNNKIFGFFVGGCLIAFIAGVVLVLKNNPLYIDSLSAINQALNRYHNAQALEYPLQTNPANYPVRGDNIYLRLFKQEGILEVWTQRENQPYKLYKTWKICTFSGGLGPKKAEGDGKSPEGFYATQKNLLNPHSRYHLFFNIDFPNIYDQANGFSGSYIMIHGKCVSVGCYAMTDASIEEIYTLVSLALDGGQKQIPIHIFPFMMSPSNMKKNQDSEYFPFWQQLKPAYDIFETQRRVPDISVERRHYVVQ